MGKMLQMHSSQIIDLSQFIVNFPFYYYNFVCIISGIWGSYEIEVNHLMFNSL